MSKNFPFTGGGGGGGGVPRQKFFFSHSEHVSSQIWCQKFFPLLRPGTPPHPRLDQVPPRPPPLRPRLDQVPPPPPPQVWIDTQSENITSRHPSDAGGNDNRVHIILKFKLSLLFKISGLCEIYVCKQSRFEF